MTVSYQEISENELGVRTQETEMSSLHFPKLSHAVRGVGVGAGGGPFKNN